MFSKNFLFYLSWDGVCIFSGLCDGVVVNLNACGIPSNQLDIFIGFIKNILNVSWFSAISPTLWAVQMIDKVFKVPLFTEGESFDSFFIPAGLTF